MVVSITTQNNRLTMKKTTTYIMMNYFKKNGFVIMSFSLCILFLLEYLSLSKWLIFLVAIIGILGAIGMMVGAYKEQ